LAPALKGRGLLFYRIFETLEAKETIIIYKKISRLNDQKQSAVDFCSHKFISEMPCQANQGLTSA